MPLVKSYAVGNGDMYYIRHSSDNFSVIDCCIPDDRRANILPEIASQSKDKFCVRLISTHPDQDHISGLVELDDTMEFKNFYCVANNAVKNHPTADFARYVELRDSSKAFYIKKGVRRKWMNQTDEVRGSAGLSMLWPDPADSDFKSALIDAASGMTPNNISPILRYSITEGPTMLWMGDLETDFMVKITDKVEIGPVDILLATHHGRLSGKVHDVWLRKMNPQLVVIGNAPSRYLDYYRGYNIITQNSAGDILFDVDGNQCHIYVEDTAYFVDFLEDEGLDHSHGLYYIGTLYT